MSRAPVRNQLRQRARGDAAFLRIAAVHQHDRHVRAHGHAAGDRIGQMLELLGQHVGRPEVRADQHVGLTGDQRADALRARRDHRHRVVESEWSVERRARNLSAVGHLAQYGCIGGRAHFRRHRFDRREQRDLGFGHAQQVGKADRVLHDVNLVLERGVDVDQRVGDEQRMRIGLHLDVQHVTDAPGGAQPVRRDHRMHRPPCAATRHRMDARMR